MSTAHATRTRDGTEVAPGSAIIPVLKKIGERRLSVVGTASYITRYGLFATAGHVLEDLADHENGTLGAGYVLEDRDGIASGFRHRVR